MPKLPLVVVGLLMAGCLGSSSPREGGPDAVAPAGLDPGGAAESPRDFAWQAPFQAGPGVAANLAIDLDDEVRGIHLGVWSDTYAFAALRVHLDGCGTFEVPALAFGAGSRFQPEPVCDVLAPGVHAIHVEADGVARGAVLVSGTQWR